MVGRLATAPRVEEGLTKAQCALVAQFDLNNARLAIQRGRVQIESFRHLAASSLLRDTWTNAAD
jgi:hypothetical protein